MEQEAGRRLMANKRKGQTVHASQWWRHLRPYWRQEFWGRQRVDDKRLVAEGVEEGEEAIQDEMDRHEWDFDVF